MVERYTAETCLSSQNRKNCPLLPKSANGNLKVKSVYFSFPTFSRELLQREQKLKGRPNQKRRRAKKKRKELVFYSLR